MDSKEQRWLFIFGAQILCAQNRYSAFQIDLKLPLMKEFKELMNQ